MNNFVQTLNPFGLATPPLSFLRRLYAYDSEIVIFPSVKEPVYRMGRRGRQGGGILNVLKNLPDTAIYVRHRLWPLMSILPQAVGMDWNRVLTELPEYDTQRFKDPAKQLDGAEAREDAAIDRKIADDLDALGGESWRLFQRLNGSSVGSGVRPEGVGFKKLPHEVKKARKPRSSAYRPLGSGPGGMFVGR